MKPNWTRGLLRECVHHILSRDPARPVANIGVFAALAIALSVFSSHAYATTSLCATPKQASDVRAAYAKRPGMPPFEIAKTLGLSEETVISALPETQNVGTSDGQAFAKIWESLAGWERPTAVMLLPNDNIVEMVGPIGMKVTSANGTVKIEAERTGFGGHFHPSTIAAIHAVALPRNDRQTLYGAIFLDADGRSILSIYSLKSSKPAIVQFLSPDAYQKTRDLISAMPRHCPQ